MVPFVLDVTSDESVVNAKQLVESRLSKYGGLHAVVNNAGIVRIGFSGWVDLEDYKVLNVFLILACKTSSANAGHRCARNRAGQSGTASAAEEISVSFIWNIFNESPRTLPSGGRIVNVSAFLARFAMPGFGPYNTAKFAIEGYTDTLR